MYLGHWGSGLGRKEGLPVLEMHRFAEIPWNYPLCCRWMGPVKLESWFGYVILILLDILSIYAAARAVLFERTQKNLRQFDAQIDYVKYIRQSNIPTMKNPRHSWYEM